MLNRRNFLIGAASVAATVATGSFPALAGEFPDPSRPGSRLDRLIPSINPRLVLLNVHTDEKIDVQFFNGMGYNMDAVMQLNRIWRDWRQDEAPQIDPRLFWGLAAVRASAMREGHDGVITFLSGYRTRATNQMLRRQGVGAADNSYHLKARAVDYHFPGIPQRRISGFQEWLEVGGTGYYGRSNFTHMDTGPIRSWGQ